LDGIEIEVLAADQRHVKSLRVRRLSEEEGEAKSTRGNKSPQERATREGAA
jgi:hypothetical protein